MTRFRDWPRRGDRGKTGDHITRHVGRDQVTPPLTCYCTRTSVIEEGDRIGACFTYNGTFSKEFMGYQPTVRRTRCEASISSIGTNSIRWKYSSKSARRQLERRKDNEPLDVAGVSS